MNQSEKIDELAKALAKCQLEMGGATKDSSNPFFKSKYADLASVIYAIKESAARNELSYSQLVETLEDGTWIHTRMMHGSGQYMTSAMKLKLGHKDDMQALGSAITYARRYMLMAIFGIPAEDDDGNAASSPASDEKNKKQITTTPKEIAQPSANIAVSRQNYINKIELMGSQLYNGKKKDFLAWLGENYGVEKTSELTDEQIPKLIEVLDKKIRENQANAKS